MELGFILFSPVTEQGGSAGKEREREISVKIQNRLGTDDGHLIAVRDLPPSVWITMCVSGSFAGLAQATCIPSLRLQFQTTKADRLANTKKLHVVSTKPKNSKYGISIQSSGPESARFKCSASLGMNQGHQRFKESRVEPFWLTFSKELLWGLRSLAMFLAEQPGQLKYIEWPSFQSTLKTATLTLVLVAVLIVALSSVDSALCYLLALMLRKSA